MWGEWLGADGSDSGDSFRVGGDDGRAVGRIEVDEDEVGAMRVAVVRERM